MTSDDLFSGTESASDTGSEEVLPNDQAPLAGNDPVGLRAWLKDLTYAEVHAFVVGFGPVFLGLLLTAFAPTLGLPILGVAVGLTLVAYGALKLQNKVLRYVVKEPHYLTGGQVLGGLLGSVAFAAVEVLGLALDTPLGRQLASAVAVGVLIVVGGKGAKGLQSRLRGWL